MVCYKGTIKRLYKSSNHELTSKKKGGWRGTLISKVLVFTFFAELVRLVTIEQAAIERFILPCFTM